MSSNLFNRSAGVPMVTGLSESDLVLDGSFSLLERIFSKVIIYLNFKRI